MSTKAKRRGEKNIIELHREKRKRRKTKKKIIVAITLILIICIGLLFTPIFNLKKIHISGNKYITSEEVIKSSGFKTGENIFKFKLKDACAKIAKNPFVDSIGIQRKLPCAMEIRIVECVPLAYVDALDGRVLIDVKGKVLEKESEENTKDLPYIQDVKYDKYTLGEKIIEETDEELISLLEIAEDLYANGLIEAVDTLYFHKKDICFDLNNGIKVVVGNRNHINSKLTMLKAVLEKLPADSVGYIDAKDHTRLRFVDEKANENLTENTSEITETQTENSSEE